MCILLKVLNLTCYLTLTFPKLSSTQLISSNEDLNNDNPLQKLFAVNLHLSSFPGDEVVVFGKERNISDLFGTVSYVVDFLGIRFGKSPVGHLRFQRPSMEIPRHNLRALREPNVCPQLTVNGGYIGNEDCLYMNIHIPKKLSNDTTKAPVLVWFHGESLEYSKEKKFSMFSTGSAKDLKPYLFLLNNVIVVTPQYRLGSFGYLSTSNEDLNGNMGMFDKLLALEWIQKYIEDFGGDSKQITIMGHGSAAMELGLLATSDLARQLFHRAILMGGSPLSSIAFDSKPKSTFAEIALQNSCPSFPTLRFVRCMQQKSIESILRSDEALSTGKHLGKIKIPLPVIQKDADGRFLPPILSNNPINSFSSGKFEQVPIILGGTSAELNGYLASITGREHNDNNVAPNIFLNRNVLKQFIRAILSRNTDSELLSELITFEYFAGLNISDPLRYEQATDITEEMVSDYLLHIPALTFAKLWSKFSPVYFYVFEYVSDKLLQTQDDEDFLTSRNRIVPEENVKNIPAVRAQQAYHGSDLKFLMEGYESESQTDRDISNLMTDLWINFIHKGSPLHSAGMDWPQYRENTKHYLHLSKYPAIESRFHERQELLWTSVFDEVVGSKNQCKSQSSSNNRNYKDSSYKLFEKSTEPLSFNYY